MASERITIGALARRSGVPVKTLRYYSDEGLLPPEGRTGGGYRVYTEEAVLRLDLIRSLRDAGLGIAAIKAILARELPLREALRLRLHAVEANIIALQQVAAALRLTLRSEPDTTDIQRICTVTRLTTEQCKTVIERFCARVAEAVPSGDDWKRDIMAASAPRLPDDPTPAQLDAWIELAELVQDDEFVDAMRTSAADTWTSGVDLAAHQRASAAAIAAARALLDRHVSPSADDARPVVDRLCRGLAAAAAEPDGPQFRAAIRDRYLRHDPRTARYWRLIAALAAKTSPPWPDEEWKWLTAAMIHHS